MVRFLDAHPTAAAAGCRLLNPDGSLQPSVRSFPTPAAALGIFTLLGQLGFFRSARRRYLRADFDYSRESRIEQPMGAALFLRREAVERAGGMDEGFFLYMEEVDLCRRLADAGHEIWYNPQASIVHWGGKSTEQAGALAVFNLLRGLLRYFRKHRPGVGTSCFIAIFKPLCLSGTVWGMLGAGFSLLFRSLFGAPADKVEKSRRRFLGKWAFLNDYALEFLFRT
jgi:hypothetical protein